MEQSPPQGRAAQGQPDKSLGAPRERAGDPARGHGGILRRGHAAGQEAYPGVSLPFDVYAAHVIERTLRRLGEGGAAPPTKEVAEALSRAALADLYLAAACETGAAGAWEAFAARTRDALTGLALRAGASRAEAEELALSMPGDLFAAPPGSGTRTRLGSYDGSGSLVGWLAVIVRRRIADRRRGPAAARPAEGAGGADGDRVPDRAAGPESDPAAAAEQAEMGRRFAAAMREGWTRLTDRERFVLVLRYRDGLAQKAIAGLLGVGEPRVSRSLAAAVDKLRAWGLGTLEPGPGTGRTGIADPREVVSLSHALSEFMGSLPPSSDPPSDG